MSLCTIKMLPKYICKTDRKKKFIDLRFLYTKEEEFIQLIKPQNSFGFFWSKINFMELPNQINSLQLIEILKNLTFKFKPIEKKN